MAEMTVICFDIDGVLCDQTTGDYASARPNEAMIALVNRLYDGGHRIVLNTSRFMGRAKGDVAEANRIGFQFTCEQLARWGVRYHELHLGKPRYDIVIDDRSLFYDSDCARIERAIADYVRHRTDGELESPLEKLGSR